MLIIRSCEEMMDLNQISNESEYKTALAQIESLMDAQLDDTQEKELERLTILVEAYEDEHYPINEAEKFRMEQEGQTKEG